MMDSLRSLVPKHADNSDHAAEVDATARRVLAIGDAGQGKGQADAIQRASERLTIMQQGVQTEVVDPLADIEVPAHQQVTQHSDFRAGDQVNLCGVYYRVQKTTRRDLVLRKLKAHEVQT